MELWVNKNSLVSVEAYKERLSVSDYEYVDRIIKVNTNNTVIGKLFNPKYEDKHIKGFIKKPYYSISMNDKYILSTEIYNENDIIEKGFIGGEYQIMS